MLSNSLNIVLHEASQHLKRHPEYDLLPIHRERIYNVVISLPNGELMRRWIDIYTAQFVLPIWEKIWAHYDAPKRALAVAEQFLRGEQTIDVVEQEIERVWPLVEELSTNLDIDYYPSADAGQAVAEAISRVSGYERWTPQNPAYVKLTETISDEWLHVFMSDTAKWASFAYAGSISHPASDKHRRMEFWMWWLFEAIPKAYQTVK